MKKVIKKGFGVTIIYLIAILCTLLVTERVNELDSKGDLKNTNSSISIKFSK